MAGYRIEEQKMGQLARYYVEFINKLRGIGRKQIVGLGDLRDGVVLCEILSGVEGMGLRGGYNQDPVGFVQALGNMKHLLKKLESYWKSVLGMLLQQQIDLISTCKGVQQQQLIMLVKLVIRTLLLSPQKQEYIEHILQTSQQAQTYFMQLISQQSSHHHHHHPPNPILSHPYSPTTNLPLYHRLQQLQRQNDKLLKLIQQLQHQLTLSKQLSKQADDKNRQQQRMISTLVEELKLVKIQLYENQQQEEELGEEDQMNRESKMQERMVELGEREDGMRMEMQRLRAVVEAQAAQLLSLKNNNTQLTYFSAQHQNLLTSNHLLQHNLQKLQSKLFALEKQLQLSLQTNNKYEEQILQLRKSLFESENMVREKNQLIEQLDNNVKYLLEEGQPNSGWKEEGLGSQGQLRDSNHSNLKSTSLYSNNAQKTTTLKQQFQSVLISHRQHFILTKLTEQNILLNKQLKSAQQENSKLQSQIQQLAVTKEENYKLVQMITHMQNYRGEENQLLVKTIYRMRMKILQQELQAVDKVDRSEGYVLKDINREH